MTQTQLLYGIVALICSSLLAYAMTPIVRVLAFRIGAVDVPLDNRRIHKKPMPRIGGVKQFRLSFSADGSPVTGTCRIDYIWAGHLPDVK